MCLFYRHCHFACRTFESTIKGVALFAIYHNRGKGLRTVTSGHHGRKHHAMAFAQCEIAKIYAHIQHQIAIHQLYLLLDNKVLIALCFCHKRHER